MKKKNDNTLPMWTIYIRKEGGYVAVKWMVGKDIKEPQHTGIGLQSETLQPLRDVLMNSGLVPIKRSKDDDPLIVETWL